MHRDVEADRYYTRASHSLDNSDHERMLRLLSGRGRVRRRIQRTPDAIDDLRRAQVHARALDDWCAVAELVLEEATALDWEGRFEEAAETVERAKPLVEKHHTPRLRALYLCAMGRGAMRRERMIEAIALLEQSVASARDCGDQEAESLALIALTAALGDAHHKRALAYHEALIALCERTGDRFHLCTAYANRGQVWTDSSAARVEHDLTTAVQLAREVGQPRIERAANRSLAEFLYRIGEPAKALPFARRAFALQHLDPEPARSDTLLVEQILAALAQPDSDSSGPT
jgi:tetratricopeptide (TPR) repeat protein